jgi:signal transduction histidine kinase
LWNYFRNFIKNYEVLAKTKNIKITLKTKNNFIINSNTYYLDRLFGNILSNSINYNEWNNNIEILIDNKTVNISDNWIWIKKEELNKIFNRFYRSNNSKLYSRDWNWLWLSIVKKVCDIFEWKIYVKSEEWKWTEINIEF